MPDTLYSATELGKIFKMPSANARGRLTTADQDGNRGKSKLYTMATAAPYLVPPSEDLEGLIKSLRPIDLPPQLSDHFWSAQLRKLKFAEQAGELWRTDDVEKVFGNAFMLIRETVALWAETIERQSGVTDEQRVHLIEMSDALMKELHLALVAMPRETQDALAAADAEMEETPNGTK